MVNDWILLEKHSSLSSKHNHIKLPLNVYVEQTGKAVVNNPELANATIALLPLPVRLASLIGDISHLQRK